PEALQAAVHQVSPLRLARPLEALHRRPTVPEIFGILAARDGNAAAPQPGRHLSRRGGPLPLVFVLRHADAPPRLNIPRNRRRDNNTATALPAPPTQPRGVRSPAHAW